MTRDAPTPICAASAILTVVDHVRSYGQLGIDPCRLLKILESLLEELLVHVSHAEVVQARGLDGTRRFALRSGQAEGREDNAD